MDIVMTIVHSGINVNLIYIYYKLRNNYNK